VLIEWSCPAATHPKMDYIKGFLLTVGGSVVLFVIVCLGGIAYWWRRLARMTRNLPSYANRSDIERNYPNDLATIRRCLVEGHSGNIGHLVSDEVLAIVKEAEDFKEAEDVLCRHQVERYSSITRNNAGTGKLQLGAIEVQCLAYIIPTNTTSYTVFILDRRAMPHQASTALSPPPLSSNLS
jgi:hypothetical protein